MLLLDITIVNVALPDIQRDARRVALGPAVGDRRLRADAGRAAAHRRLARRPLRPPAAVRDRHRRLHRSARCCAALASDPTVPRARPRVPGHRRRDHVRHRAGAARPARSSGARPRHRVRRLRRRPPASPSRSARCSAACSPAASPGAGSSSSTSRSASSRSPSRCARSRSRATRTPRPAGLDRLRHLQRRRSAALVYGLIRGSADGWGSTDRRRARWSPPRCCWSAFVVAELRPARADVRPRRCSASRRSSAA